MNHKLIWFTVIVLCGVVFVALFHITYITEDEVHRRIQSEIPPGSTYDQVTDFLKKNGWIEQGNLMNYPDWGTTLTSLLSEEEKPNIKWYSNAGVRPVEKSLFEARGISIGFFYDKEGRLIT